VADAVRTELQRGGDDMVNRIVAELSQHHIHVDRTQLLSEMKDIRMERDDLFKAKVVADRRLIDGIAALSLHEQRATFQPPNPTQSFTWSSSSQSLDDILECGIMQIRMEDPVTLVQDGKCYDRKHLCEWLLQNPTKTPLGVVFDQPLQYVDAFSIRSLLTNTYGDKAFIKFDDTEFKSQYVKQWKSATKRYNYVDESSSSAHSSPNHASLQQLCKVVQILSHGMNQEKIDWTKADILLESQPQEPLVLAMRAYFHEDVQKKKDPKIALNNGRMPFHI
jgi:hypothetical protein